MPPARVFRWIIVAALAQSILVPVHAADLQAIKRRLDAQLRVAGLAQPAIGLRVVDDGPTWPTDKESFAFEKTELDGSAAVYALRSWAQSSQGDEAAFVISHEIAHGLCGHAFKTYGLYSDRSQAVGLDLGLLAEGANADLGFQFSNRAADQAMEVEADRVGAQLARLAGYNPLVGARQAIGSSASNPGHAAGAIRVEAIGSFIDELEKAEHGQVEPQFSWAIASCQKREPGSY